MKNNIGAQKKEIEAIISLAREIDMPAEMTADIEKSLYSGESGINKLLELSPRLARPETAHDASVELTKAKEEFKKASVELAVWLNAALIVGETVYKEKNIPYEIFIETMKAFSRFVKEHKVSFGEYGFDRTSWVWRQTSGLLFRLGALEFEIYQPDEEFVKNNSHPLIRSDKKYLSVHIPSDASIKREDIDRSYMQAKEFFAKRFPEHKLQFFFCSSWMLSPTLKSLLPENSQILAFAGDYELLCQRDDSNEGNIWVFKTESDDYENLPAETSLQKKARELLLNGGHIGAALGKKDI